MRGEHFVPVIVGHFHDYVHSTGGGFGIVILGLLAIVGIVAIAASRGGAK